MKKSEAIQYLNYMVSAIQKFRSNAALEIGEEQILKDMMHGMVKEQNHIIEICRLLSLLCGIPSTQNEVIHLKTILGFGLLSLNW